MAFPHKNIANNKYHPPQMSIHIKFYTQLRLLNSKLTWKEYPIIED